MYKILALTKEGSGSKYHRIELPLKSLNGKFIKKGEDQEEIQVSFSTAPGVTEEDFKTYDMIYYHWGINNTVDFLGGLKAQYPKCKVIMDIDDYWVLPSKHPSKKNYYGNIPLFLANADSVVTSTKRLAAHIFQYNNMISVNENDLPIGSEQFQIIEKDVISVDQKIAIGVIGSSSHLMDYLSIKHNLNKIGNDPLLKQKCKFVLCGYIEGDKTWEKIKSLFTYDGFELELVPGELPHEYMKLYNKVDILLAPLSENEYNKCKSGLKLVEAACYGVPVIASPLYTEKEFSGCWSAKKSGDFYRILKHMVEKEDIRDNGLKLAEVNIGVNNFDGRIENLRKLVEWHANNKIVYDVPGLDLYSIRYDEKQPCDFTPYDNFNPDKVKSWRFEYSPMQDIISNIPSEKYDQYTGILSWKFGAKTGLYSPIISKILTPIISSKKYDAIILSPSHWKNGAAYLDFSYKQHEKLEELLKKCLDHIKVDYIKSPKHVVYSNFFILRNDLYVDYINNWIKPCLDYMENEIWNEVNIDANYTGGLSPEQLKEYTGLDYYNYVTFVLERLILFYLEDKKVKVL